MRVFKFAGVLAFSSSVAGIILSLLTVMAGSVCAVEIGDADYYYVRGDWHKAAEAFDRMMAADASAGNPTALKAAESHYRAGNLSRAVELAGGAAAEGHGADAYILTALIEARRGRADEAVLDLMSLKRSPGDEHKILTAIGVITQAADPSAALSYLTKAVELDPDYFWAWFTIGLIHEEAENFEQATKAYKNAVRVNPLNAQAQNNLGYSYKERHFYAYAVEHYRRAIELMPDNPGFYYNIGNAYTHQERIDEAFAAYKKALELSPGFAKAHYNMARTYLRMDMVREAIEEFRRYIEFGDATVFRAVAPKGAVEEEIEDLELFLKSNSPGRPPQRQMSR